MSGGLMRYTMPDSEGKRGEKASCSACVRSLQKRGDLCFSDLLVHDLYTIRLARMVVVSIELADYILEHSFKRDHRLTCSFHIYTHT